MELKGICFILLLTAAAVWDIRKREIPDVIPVMIVACGLVSLRPIAALAGFVVTALPYYLGAVLVKGEGFPIGGGDVKLMGACGFVLGAWAGTVQSILSLTMIVAVGAFIAVCTKKKINEIQLPLAPFFCAGGIVSYLVF